MSALYFNLIGLLISLWLNRSRITWPQDGKTQAEEGGGVKQGIRCDLCFCTNVAISMYVAVNNRPHHATTDNDINSRVPNRTTQTTIMTTTCQIGSGTSSGTRSGSGSVVVVVVVVV